MGTFSSIAIIVAGVFIIYLGYLIRVKKKLSLIIGFSETTFYGEKDKYAKRTGVTAIILRVIVLLMPLVVSVFGESVIQIYKVIIGVYIVKMLIVANYWRLRF
ncbi:DUF3784 domain-containing protein [Bacillus sp. JJ1521]|uniref:DUF3784 domain-containing protein n=1 Tax=Bacillus sp. JJ1521 TaxID=3122957 RepID=UPI002FFF88BF